MTKITEKSGLSKLSLYKAFSKGSKPQFSIIIKVSKDVGGQMSLNPISN